MKFIQKIINKARTSLMSICRTSLRDKFLNIFIHTPIDYNVIIENKKVLIIGIYLTDYDNLAIHLFEQYAKSKRHQVEQKWIAIGEADIPLELAKVTIFHSKEKIPKFKLLNKILEDINVEQYDYIIFSDDDIAIHDNFIDIYIDIIEYNSLRLAQPARASHSYNVHPIVLQDKNCIARETNFVEIGPIFSLHKSIYFNLIPFPSDAEMGFGLDFIWPVIAQKNNFKIGIIDIVPVDHSYRAQSKTYSSDINLQKMNVFLADHENNAFEEKVVIKKYRK